MAKIKVFGEPSDEMTMEQAHGVAETAERVALMADNHRGYWMPIGGVAAWKDKVAVAGVGYDIGCGNTAIRTRLKLNDVAGITREEAERNPFRVASNRVLNDLADEINDQISFGLKRGRRNEHENAPDASWLWTDSPAVWAIPNEGDYRVDLLQKAADQLGTVGGGNHYVDVFVDEEDYLWVGVHFGSRGFGWTIAQNFLALSAGERWGMKPPRGTVGLLDIQNPIGHDYWHLKEVASRYAFEGRKWVAETVARILGVQNGDYVEMVENHHNDAWREEHGGEELIVVRKGATPAWPGQKGFVGGSMGDHAVIVQGADTDVHVTDTRTPETAKLHWLQRQAMFSTVHGAGRVMGRREAKRTLTQDEVGTWLAREGVILRGGGLDEAPQAYKRLPDVLAAQEGTIEVLHDLKPLIVCMAPGNLRDPYKD